MSKDGPCFPTWETMGPPFSSSSSSSFSFPSSFHISHPFRIRAVSQHHPSANQKASVPSHTNIGFVPPKENGVFGEVFVLSRYHSPIGVELPYLFHGLLEGVVTYQFHIGKNQARFGPGRLYGLAINVLPHHSVPNAYDALRKHKKVSVYLRGVALVSGMGLRKPKPNLFPHNGGVQFVLERGLYHRSLLA